MPFSENGLDELFKKTRIKKNFNASSSLKSADVYIIAVPTPISSLRAEPQGPCQPLAPARF